MFKGIIISARIDRCSFGCKPTLLSALYRLKKGKMFKKAFEDRDLAPENLSRTLEDSGTVTSVLIPWNTCGAYQAGVLGVGVGEYAVFAIFNWLSPFMTLLFAAFGLKIRQLSKKK